MTNNGVATATQSEPTRLIKTIISALESTFVTSWNSYLDQDKKNEVSIQVKRLALNNNIEKATKDATMEIDQEGTAPPQNS